MAEFENYHDTAANYSEARRTPGVSQLLGVIASSCASSLSEASVLEIGCGTGYESTTSVSAICPAQRAADTTIGTQ